MSDLPSLIKRLEEATGPSRELDAKIHLAVVAQHLVAGEDGTTVRQRLGHWDDAPPYTSSIDAALTLVPEGWEWQVSNRAPAPHAGRAYLHNGELIFAGMGGSRRNPRHRSEECVAATPALALCIAALRARDA